MATLPVKVKGIRHGTSGDGEKLVYLNVFSPDHEINFDVRLPESQWNGDGIGDEVELEYVLSSQVQVITTRSGGNMGVVNPVLDFVGLAH